MLSLREQQSRLPFTHLQGKLSRVFYKLCFDIYNRYQFPLAPQSEQIFCCCDLRANSSELTCLRRTHMLQANSVGRVFVKEPPSRLPRTHTYKANSGECSTSSVFDIIYKMFCNLVKRPATRVVLGPWATPHFACCGIKGCSGCFGWLR